MSNIYIQEPPSDGKVLLTTSVGDIDVELWSKEAPKACRNFVQLCLENYYDGTLFHRVVPNFIAQGGDPTGTGEGGESIYGKPFKDEFHSRLRFNRRGLVGMANAGKNDNGSQFFFTLGEAGELNNKHTLFGKVTGNTVYNMIKLGECEIEHERPLYPHKILKTKVLGNPFDDIVPRKIAKETEKTSKKSKIKGKKDFKLLSFGEEAEEDEEQTVEAVNTLKTKGKGKSSHDLLDDEKLSVIPAIDQTFQPPTAAKKKRKKLKEDESSSEDESLKTMVRRKLRKEDSSSMNFIVDEGSDGDTPNERSAKIIELKKEAKRLKKELKSTEKEPEVITEDAVEEDNNAENDLVKEFKIERKKYKQQNKKLGKGAGRETETLAMLASFQNKLSAAAMMATLGGDDEDEEVEEKDQEDEEYDPSDMSWMTHKLTTTDEQNKKVIDANIADLDRYEMHDPRNPLNVRRREASKQAMKAKGQKK